ncbi:DUF5672 family protein [Lacihabitans sp. LS3-19]|uniref:DUF5672 family protein n=1 Tax=Lacihabitans sp. LS3-19 TaxID=2487335 RepID=UPI0020CEC6FA|nr:DUF5672 family protein [Lacihabitans sp. LS3-19]
MEVAVIIPIYKEKLSENEIKSLKQAKFILGEFPIYFVCPEDLDINKYLEIAPNAKIKRFGNDYFQSIVGYSQLMLSPHFYKTFFDYQYILIYQLDAFVFKNELLEWCFKNYDYIGAPWISAVPITNGKPIIDMSKWFINRVGNGGLSLRKVKSHYLNTLIFRPFLKYFIKNEDMFWGLFLYWLNPFFKRPKVKEALEFAFEMEPMKSFQIIDKKLPFGVHAWEKYEPEFWKKIID